MTEKKLRIAGLVFDGREKVLNAFKGNIFLMNDKDVDIDHVDDKYKRALTPKSPTEI